MMRLREIQLILIGLSFLVMIHQYINFGKLFEISDVHHELFFVTFLFAGILLFVLERKGKLEED